MTALDRVLPDWDFREVHATAVAAAPERVFDAVREVTLAEMPFARLLMRARGMDAGTERPVLEQALATFELLADDPGRELVLGSVGQPWKLRGGRRPRAPFAGFTDAGYVKMALNFRLDGGRLSTETRVLALDPASRRAFRRYWLLIRPFSGLVRRVWLRAIKRRAMGEG